MRNSHTIIIDRFADDATAVVEIDGAMMVPIPRLLLPHDATADSVLRVDRQRAGVMISIDSDATDAAHRKAVKVADRLRGRDPGGDIVL